MWITSAKQISNKLKRYSSESYKNKQQDEIQSAWFHYIKNNFFQLKISLVNVTKPQLPADLITFYEETLNGKLHFLCSALNYDVIDLLGLLSL